MDHPDSYPDLEHLFKVKPSFCLLQYYKSVLEHYWYSGCQYLISEIRNLSNQIKFSQILRLSTMLPQSLIIEGVEQ